MRVIPYFGGPICILKATASLKQTLGISHVLLGVGLDSEADNRMGVDEDLHWYSGAWKMCVAQELKE